MTASVAAARPRLSDVWNFPSFVRMAMFMREPVKVDLLHAPKALGEVRYVDRAPLEKECADYLKVVAESAPPLSILMTHRRRDYAAAMLNEHYPRLRTT